MEERVDNYNLINSKTIGNYCREINHKFNTEELAVLVYRNKKMTIQEKIDKYNDLIQNYPDMEVKERSNCKHYDSVKDMIKEEIERLKDLKQKMQEDEMDFVYTYTSYYSFKNDYFEKYREGYNEIRSIFKTYKEVIETIKEEIAEDEENEITIVRITKRPITKSPKYIIIEEYEITEKKEMKLINIIDEQKSYLNIANIFLNIPTPFKKGDILIGNSNTPFFSEYILTYEKFPFVLTDLCTWNNNVQSRLDRFDSSDMQGPGYVISEDGKLCTDNIFDYDSWEYYDGKLKGISRLLKAVSSLLKDKISLELFLDVYEKIKLDFIKQDEYLYYPKEILKLAGIDDENNML